MISADTPAGLELVNAINQDIEENGEVVCVQRLVTERCTIPLSYAYELLKACAPIWGYKVDRLPRAEGGFVLRIQRL